MKKSLLEATRIHHGSFKDLQTFLDQDGNPMALEQTSLDDLMNAAKERGKSRQTNSNGNDEFDGPDAPGSKDDSSSSKQSDKPATGNNEGPASGSNGEDEKEGDVGPDPNFEQPDFDMPEDDPWAVPDDDDDYEGDGEGPDDISPDDYDDEEGEGQGKGPGKPGDGKEGDSEGEEEGEGEGDSEQNQPQPPSGPPKMPKNPEQQKPQKPPEPEFKTPEKGQMFRDVMTGKTYKWDGKKFVIQR